MGDYTITFKRNRFFKKTLKMPSKNGNQNCSHVGCAKYKLKA